MKIPKILIKVFLGCLRFFFYVGFDFWFLVE